MRDTIKKNVYKGLKIGRNEINISLLQFANDTIFMGKDTFSNMLSLKIILRGFKLVSGLRNNFSKSCFGAFEVDISSMLVFVKVLNYSLLSFPFTYLGILVMMNLRLQCTWDPIISNIKKKLDCWKHMLD
ncbi:hypothetical protein Fmac_032474 [Flemingia macrophylla]|uniref:Reverse transcriptase domain-containing protein n=1 Tax=Flemingia macrophylla TaxID=520843 RepID=A0ABD1L4Z7_9FABA